MQLALRILAIVTTLALFGAGTFACAQDKPPAYGSIEGYPIPAGGGGGPELDFCYRYSKRIWEIVKGQPRNGAAFEKLSGVARQALGSQGASEDIAELEKYFSGSYQTKEEMAGARFYGCGMRLKLPLEERHKRNAALCFRSLNLPSYVADLKSNGQSAAQVQEALKAANPPAMHPAIESTVKLIYARTSDADVDGFLKDTFLACIVRLGENEGAR